MKVFKLLAVTAALSVSGLAMADDQVVHSGSTFDANQLIPTGVRAEVGTTGYGGALLWTANPYVGLALGYNGGNISWSDDLSINGTKYDMDMDNKLAYLNAEIRPWGASQNMWARSVYMAAGVGYVDSEYKLDKKVGRSASVTVDGERFSDTAKDFRIDGKLKYDNDIAPYLGLGFAPQITKNWGVFGEVGAYYTGNPNVSLNSNNDTLVGSSGSRDLGQALGQEEYNIANKDKYQWMPVGKVGVSYHW